MHYTADDSSSRQFNSRVLRKSFFVPFHAHPSTRLHSFIFGGIFIIHLICRIPYSVTKRSRFKKFKQFDFLAYLNIFFLFAFGLFLLISYFELLRDNVTTLRTKGTFQAFAKKLKRASQIFSETRINRSVGQDFDHSMMRLDFQCSEIGKSDGLIENMAVREKIQDTPKFVGRMHLRFSNVIVSLPWIYYDFIAFCKIESLFLSEHLFNSP